MTHWKKIRGTTEKSIEIINPLADLIAFMQRQVASGQTHRHVYEMTLYDPARDAGKPSNRQCLSFLSFKLTRDNKLLLTAVYRNHHYLARALGNFIGLGRLQAFVAEQVGIERASLTCLATHAEIDHQTSRKDGCVSGWTKTQARTFLEEVRAIASAT
jgi:thymidylate synthase